MPQSIEELAKKRKKWVDANKENNFEDGLKQLLTDLYPDNAHFIYELLQNAEDSGASVVRFLLTNTGIEFEHNSGRLFDLKDVESITSIGASTKHDDHTSIGKFGVGFKAVFAYTNTPEIHSGNIHFRIHDLVVPETEGVINPIMDERTTRFVFPFDHPKKCPTQSIEEIERGLLALNDNTLLFLNNIQTIEYLLPSGSGGLLKRVDGERGHIEIRAHHPGGQDTASHWLRFQKEVEVTDEYCTVKTCKVAIAYSLMEEDETKKQLQRWKIVPLDHGQVSIYFPADKETSNLRFHLHAPFASTVARDSVRDCQANLQLRDSIAALAVESLADIRDRGMLTMGFLTVLPNKMDSLSSFYEPIRVAIVSAFKDEALMPTRSGSHAPATALYRGPARIAEFLNDDDLSELTDYKPPLWAANPPQLYQREDRFLDSLAIENWGWSELSLTVSSINKEKRASIEQWIAQKDDAWMMRFYALLGEACDMYNAPVDVKYLCIVRVDADQCEHVLPHNAFFSPEQGAISSADIRFVKPTVYSIGKSDAQKKYAISFLERIGVRPYDAKTIIELKLSHYLEPPGEVENCHYDDLKEFIAFWKENPIDVGFFKKHTFLLGLSNDEKLYWLKPEDLCMDTPYIETGLSKFTNIHKKYVLWDEYFTKFDNSELKCFTDFLKALDVMYCLNIKAVSIHTNPNKDNFLIDLYSGAKETFTKIDVDYSIDALESYLQNISELTSRLIWQAVIKFNGNASKAQYKPNQTYNLIEGNSQLVGHLKSIAWIPDKSGEFHKPQDMTREELLIDYPYDDRNGLLTAIGFGEQAKKRSEEYVLQNHHAQHMGFESAEEAEKMACVAKLLRECGQSPDRLLEQYMPSSEKKEPSFPSRPVVNPERREERLAEQISDAPEKEYEMCERRDRISRGTIDPVPLLREQYTNSFNEMFCQICKSEMPFKKRNGAYYFEAVEVLSSIFLLNENAAQYLALCPLCAAKYQEFVKREEKPMVELKNAIANSEGDEVQLMLGDEKTTIKFVETHLLDLKVIINQMPKGTGVDKAILDVDITDVFKLPPPVQQYSHTDVPIDTILAKDLYRKACENGDDVGCANYRRLCDDEEEIKDSADSIEGAHNNLQIGDAFEGGIIGILFKIQDPEYNSNTPHGLIVTTKDPKLCCTWQKAKSFCMRYNEDGTYTDWRLPSSDELRKLYLNRQKIGDFANNYYWSCSSCGSVWCQSFITGAQRYLDASGHWYVRLVRTF